MPSERFEAWWRGFCTTGDICPLRLGQTRETVRELFGEPDDFGAMGGRGSQPQIWKYRDLELHFGPSVDDGLSLVFAEQGGVVTVCIRASSGT
jgi:hypothetical protein